MGKRKSHNLGAMMREKGIIPEGHPMDLDDMEIIEQLGLDAKLAYTPGINEAAFQKQRENSIEDQVKGGVDIKQATMKADKDLSDARKNYIKMKKK